MPRSFDVSVDSPASVDQVHAAFSAEDYWLARLGNMSGGTTLESLVVDDDRTVRVTTTQDLGRDLLPGIVSKFYRRDIKVRHNRDVDAVGRSTPRRDRRRRDRSARGRLGGRLGRAHRERFTADAQRHGGVQSATGRRNSRKLHRARIRSRDTGCPGLHRQMGHRARLNV